MALWQPQLIPRRILRAMRITLEYDEYNMPSETISYFQVENAGVQPASGKSTNPTLDGYRNKQVFKIFTTTPVRTADEGDRSVIADRIEIYPNRWFAVIAVADWSVGVRSHYEATVVEVNKHDS